MGFGQLRPSIFIDGSWRCEPVGLRCLKTKNMVESEFILLGTERDSDGVPWALLASDRDGRLEFAGPAILNPPQALRAAWRERMAALAAAKPPLRGLRQGTAQWLRPELRVRVKHLKAKGRVATRDRQAVHQRLRSGLVALSRSVAEVNRS
jgi:hypothetical protein